MNTASQPLERWLLPGLFCYFTLHVIIRATGSPVLDLDEAEQIIVTQWWLAGYSGQPPLYAWLQKLAFDTLGIHLLSLSLVKNSLLFLTYMFVYLAVRRLVTDGRIAALATLSLLLIPQVAWESQRDLTHSVIVTTVAAASLYGLLRWMDRPTVGHYLLVGILVGFGLLSKYSYAMFAAAVVLTLLSLPRGRELLLHPRILLSLAVCLIIMTPHLLWLAETREVGTQAVDKLNFGDGLWPLSGLSSLAVAVVAFLTPLWIVLLLVFRRDSLRVLTPPRTTPAPFPTGRYLAIVLLLLVITVVLLEAAHFKDRWMLPLLLVFPIHAFAAMGAASLTPGRVRTFVSVCMMVPVLALLVMTARVQDWPILEGQHRHGYPFEAATAELQALGFRQGLIVGDRSFIAGNLRFRFQHSQAMIPSISRAGLRCVEGDDLLVAWDAERNPQMPASLVSWLSTELGFDATDAVIHRLPGDTEHAPLGAIVIPGDNHILDENCRIQDMRTRNTL